MDKFTELRLDVAYRYEALLQENRRESEQVKKCYELAMRLFSDSEAVVEYWERLAQYENPDYSKLREMFQEIERAPHGLWEVLVLHLLRDSPTVAVNVQVLRDFYESVNWWDLKPEACFGLPFGLQHNLVTPEEWCAIKGLDPNLADFKNYVLRLPEDADDVDRMIGPGFWVTLRRLAKAGGVTIITYYFSHPSLPYRKRWPYSYWFPYSDRHYNYKYTNDRCLMYKPDGETYLIYTTDEGERIIRNVEDLK